MMKKVTYMVLMNLLIFIDYEKINREKTDTLSPSY